MQALIPFQLENLHASVVIPTYRRPGPLRDCIRSLVQTGPAPHEIIVVGREGDASTADAVAQAQELWQGKTTLKVGWVTEPGHVPPVRKGLALASGEIVFFVDDDLTVTAQWLEHMIAPFCDPSVGVVGGQMITPACKNRRVRGKPGRMSWYGRQWGNVGVLGGDSPIEVESVMEGDWAWRKTLLSSLSFDPVLNFDDASMYGLDLCWQALRRGFRVIYEPRGVAYHHVAPRASGLDRADRPRRAYSYTRNYTYIMLKNLPRWRRPIFLAWWFLIGERDSCGLAAVAVDTLLGRAPRPANVWGAWKGKVEGLRLAAGARTNA